jgi:glucose-6-phosphate 1-epimerase
VAISLPSSVRRIDDRGLPVLDVSTARATARVFFHGAHVAAWQPTHATAPVIWLSSRTLLQPDKPIRGGVPICFPWFGPHPTDRTAPAHGFARLADWTLTAAEEAADGTVTLELLLQDGSRPLWPHPFEMRHRISIGTTLTMALEVRNTGAEPFACEEALHTYFAVRSIEQVTIAGLEGTDYLDKVAGFARRTQAEAIRFAGETDRVYLDTMAAVEIQDRGHGRRILIAKSGSHSTVVWNPWIDKARAMPDFGDDEWRDMVCVETANVGDARIRLEPGGSHTMSAVVSVDNADNAGNGSAP